jgi:hypothetical protein
MQGIIEDCLEMAFQKTIPEMPFKLDILPLFNSRPGFISAEIKRF